MHIRSRYQELGWLMIQVCRLHHARADESLERLGLFRGQARLLMTLFHQDGPTHSELAARLEISPAAATKVIKRMERAGYVQRQADPADERVSRVYLRDAGRALIAEIDTAFDRLDRHMLAGLDEPELAQLCELLLRMQVNLQESQPAASSPVMARSEP